MKARRKEATDYPPIILAPGERIVFDIAGVPLPDIEQVKMSCHPDAVAKARTPEGVTAVWYDGETRYVCKMRIVSESEGAD
jgi:hypothetical protein